MAIEHFKKLVNTGSEAAVLNELVAAVRAITDYDRAVVYRFDEQWNGRVIAESHNERLSSLLNHQFPASDIPPQVRALFATNPLRFIADANQDPVAVVPSWRTPIEQRLCERFLRCTGNICKTWGLPRRCRWLFSLVMDVTSRGWLSFFRREEIERINWAGEPVTVSLGVTEWASGDTFKNLLVRADSAMYRAKHSGRNRVFTDKD